MVALLSCTFGDHGKSGKPFTNQTGKVINFQMTIKTISTSKIETSSQQFIWNWKPARNVPVLKMHQEEIMI